MAVDRTGELKQRIEELDSKHDLWLREWQLAFGRLLEKVSRNRFTRHVLANSGSRLASRLIVGKRVKGSGGDAARDAVEVAFEWLKIPTLLRMPYELEKATDDEVVVVWRQCAVGFDDPSQLDTCRAACNMDIRTVERLGGRLVITENMLEGAPCCRFVITRK